MASLVDAECICQNASEPVDQEGALQGSSEEVPVMEEGFNKLESSPGIVRSLQGQMDVDNDIKPESGAKSLANSMDNVETDSSDFQSRKYDRDDTAAERQDKAYEDHLLRQNIQGSRDRPAGPQIYHDRWGRSRENNWQSLRGREFGDWETRDRYLGGRGFRSQDFRRRELRHRESRGRRGAYQNLQHSVPRTPSIWRSQRRRDSSGLESIRVRNRRNLDRDGGNPYQRTDMRQQYY